MEISPISLALSAKDGLESVTRQVMPTIEYALAESDSLGHLPVPPTERMRLVSGGFHSKTALIYDFDTHGKDAYLSSLQRRQAGRINSPWTHLLNDKVAFHYLLSNHAEHRPLLYGVLDDGTIQCIDGEGSKDAFGFVASTLEETAIVLKPAQGTAGDGVIVISRDGQRFNWNGERINESAFQERLDSMSQTLVSEYIEQAEYANRIFPDSVNTIRILTMYDEQDEDVFIATAVHRFGSNESAPVDNWSSGGFSAGIDLESGELMAAAQSPHNGNVEWHPTHPDTQTKIAGTKIEQWDEVRRVVTEIASSVPYIPYIGWDVVVTDTGVKILEANSRTDVDLLQIHHPLLTDDRVRRFYRHHDVI